MVTPSVPPYAHIDKQATQCVAFASSRYQVPELLLHAILVKENGRTGRCTRLTNGSMDCGLAQINSAWQDYFSKKGVDFGAIVNNQCTNIQASAYILRTYYNQKQDWFKAIVSYNIGPNKWTPPRYSTGYKYASSVVRTWWGFERYVQTHSAQEANNPARSGRPGVFSGKPH